MGNGLGQIVGGGDLKKEDAILVTAPDAISYRYTADINYVQIANI